FPRNCLMSRGVQRISFLVAVVIRCSTAVYNGRLHTDYALARRSQALCPVPSNLLSQKELSRFFSSTASKHKVRWTCPAWLLNFRMEDARVASEATFIEERDESRKRPGPERLR